ncbi:MAG TPA: beta-L-arabinofuranosidase domain-containing protein, partial [Gemmatimonadaceae bacterium]
AISAMYAATGDKRFKDRVDYMVNEFKTVQDRNGDGYLVALEGGRKCFGALKKGEIKAAAFDLNGEWSPWYTLHKTFAGLRDAYRFTGNRTALDVERKFAGWAEGILAGLNDEQIQHMLETEFGGMNEVLVDLYADTGDPRWLKLSYDFEHRVFVDPLKRHEDVLGGTHANTQIPKLIGSAERYAYTRRPEDLMAASFFYDSVVNHHSFSTGGHGTDEYYGPRDVIGARVDGRTAESCNVYNMLKYSRLMFSMEPDIRYADYQERGLYNHQMASFDPQSGQMCYMVPVGQGVTHEYQDMQHSFTCCVGTGMENHALIGDGLYFENGDRLWVNQYVPSTATWAEKGVQLAMASDFPEGDTATLTLTAARPREFTLSVRRPYWVGEGFAVTVNGSPVAVDTPMEEQKERRTRRTQYHEAGPESSFVDIKRTWRSGDVVKVTLPKTLRLEPTPDMPNRVAIMWGPLVLAGDLGPEPVRGRARGENGELLEQDTPRSTPVVPVFVTEEVPVESWLKPVAGEPGHFRTAGVGREPNAGGKVHDVDLVPFYRLHQRVYATYWDVLTPTVWAARLAGYVTEAERLKKLDAATVAEVKPVNKASEAQYHFEGAKDVTVQRMSGRLGRASRTGFSYQIPVEAGHPMAIVATYYSADRRTSPASFEVLVDGQKVADQEVPRTDPGRFYDVTYSVPASLVAGKPAVTVKFQAKAGSQVAAVYGLRMVRADQLP